MDKNQRKYNIPIFIPHRGCPNDCAFCNQKKITGIDTDVTLEDVKELIRKSLDTAEENSCIEVAFFGGSFTGLEKSVQREFLKAAGEFFPRISGIRLSTRADYINEDIIKLLKEHNVTAVELGVQSTDEDVLKKNLRGHGFSEVKKAAKLIKEAGFELGLQMMLGMYGSNFEKDIKTAEDIISLSPETTRIYPTVVLKGTKLEEYYNEGKYKPYTIDEAAECAKEVYLRFKKNNVTVLRMGLHSSEELESGSIVAGPYHPAFGEMVFSLIYRREIEERIKENNLLNTRVVIEAYKKEISKIIGQKKSNIKYFKDKYGIDLYIEETDEEREEKWILKK